VDAPEPKETTLDQSSVEVLVLVDPTDCGPGRGSNG